MSDDLNNLIDFTKMRISDLIQQLVEDQGVLPEQWRRHVGDYIDDIYRFIRGEQDVEHEEGIGLHVYTIMTLHQALEKEVGPTQAKEIVGIYINELDSEDMPAVKALLEKMILVGRAEGILLRLMEQSSTDRSR